MISRKRRLYHPTMFLTHWLELSGVDRLMALVSDEDHASASHGPEEQESTELAFWSVVAPRRPATSPGALRESGTGRNAHRQHQQNGSHCCIADRNHRHGQ